jgi:hypothetical protein
MQVNLKILIFLVFLQIFPLACQEISGQLVVESSLNFIGKAKQTIISDDFEHGTLSGWGNTGDWENSEESPVSGLFSLKHSSGSGISYIYHPLEIADLNANTITWRLQLKNGNWDPSGTNKFWFYLTSDQSNLSSNVNGYALGVNFTGTDDLLKIWRITNGTLSATVLSSTLDWDVNTLAGIEVTRFPGGDWELKLNRQGGFNNLVTEGTGSDNTHLTSHYCGLYFVYTTTRAGLLWMDDVYVGKPITDTIPPHIEKAEVLTFNTIRLTFNEFPEPTTALDISNYLINGSVQPVSAGFLTGSQQQVLLSFSQPFIELTPFELSVSGIEDLAGNVMEPYSINLYYESFKANEIRATANNRLKITFNREVNISSAEIRFNYTLYPGNITPVNASVSTTQNNEVFVEFETPFSEKTEYELHIENISDLYDDILVPSILEFIYFVASPYDVLISEIMAKPAPSFGLPGYEYIELYNKTPYMVDLTGWTIRLGTTSRTIPEYQITPGGYLILCNSNFVSSFNPYGETLGINSFPAITDAGQTISLWNNLEQVISSVTYSDKWYNSSFKAAGGWSLEMIDPENPCAGSDNWSASMDPSGGTPGRVNSILAENPDLIPPVIHRAVPLSDKILRVFFTEPYNYTGISIPGIFNVDNNIGSPSQVIISPPVFISVDLVFAQSFVSGIQYTISLDRVITDCAGNLLGSRNSVKFALPSQPEYLDLVVNEILFNPLDGGVNFVEIYNRSNKVINLQDVLITSRDLSSGELRTIYQASINGFLIFPMEYAVVTTRAELVLRDYYTPNVFKFSEISTLPSFNNDKGNVILLNKSMEMLDEFTYDEKMHYPLLTGVKGVSLERINFNQETNNRQNWHSASQTVGFATPAYQNSQFNAGIETTEEVIIINPDVFSPDNDGVDDLVNIYYEFEKPGFVATITIFDSRGRIVKKLATNQLLGTNGFFSWDGTTDARQMSPLGIYLIFIDLFHADGSRKQYKKTCVLAGKLH